MNPSTTDEQTRRLSKAHRCSTLAALGAIRARMDEADYQLSWETPEGDDLALRELARVGEQVAALFRSIGRKPPE